ncbi:MAG: class I SAM-dependent methyltransferase, partial [Desulfobulbaceae bacterium]
MTDLLQGIWADFFDGLPRNAKLLDLGTGGGAVLREAQARRPDLQLTGVDYAKVLPDLGEEIAMLPGVCLEDLPFDNESFDVVTSQFAIEYASLSQAISEIKRVLSKGGVFLFLCHHVDSIIVHDNVKRLAAIKDLLAGSGLL